MGEDVADRANAKRDRENKSGKGVEMNRETPRNKDDKAQEHDQGIRERGGWCSSLRVRRGSSLRVRRGSSLRVRGGGWVTMNSHNVEISIAGDVRKMVHDPTPKRVFFFFLYHVLCIQLQGTKTACSASYGKEKTPSPPGCIPPGTMEKAINPSPSGLGPTAHQPHKIRNPTLTT